MSARMQMILFTYFYLFMQQIFEVLFCLKYYSLEKVRRILKKLTVSGKMSVLSMEKIL